MFDIFIRFTRIRLYLFNLFSIFVLIFLISPNNLFSYKAIIIFLANLFLTIFAYTINDVEDSDDDYHDIKKRKRNPIANGDLSKKQGYIISFLIFFTGLSLLLLLNYLVFLFGLFFGLIVFLYSWKPIRLKSIPFLDVISHVILLGVFQFFLTYITFKPLDFKMFPFLLIVAPFPFAAEIFHELVDFEIDKKTKIKNTVQKFGKFNPTKMIIVLTIIITLGFVSLSYIGYLSRSMILFTPIVFLIVKWYLEDMWKNFNYKKQYF